MELLLKLLLISMAHVGTQLYDLDPLHIGKQGWNRQTLVAQEYLTRYLRVATHNIDYHVHG